MKTFWKTGLFKQNPKVLASQVDGNVEPVTQVVGWRTQDQKVTGSSLDNGLHFKVAVIKTGFHMMAQMTQYLWGAWRKLWPYRTCVHVTAISQKAQFVREGLCPMIRGVIVKLREKVWLDPDYKPLPLPFLKKKIPHKVLLSKISLVSGPLRGWLRIRNKKPLPPPPPKI